jgi:hypothetical protein
MGRKAFFVESKLEVFDYATCDKCGLKIKDVQDGKCFWRKGGDGGKRSTPLLNTLQTVVLNCTDLGRGKEM